MKKLVPLFPALLLASLLASPFARAEGSIHQHLLLDLVPLATSPNNSLGSAVGLSYDRIHDELKTAYTLTVEADQPYDTSHGRTDAIVMLGFATEITPAFSLGARIGAVVNNPVAPVGLGALALRLPALHPADKQFFGFYFEEVDLGLSGSGERYAAFRLGMLLL